MRSKKKPAAAKKERRVPTTDVTPGSGNVFADLGLPDAEDLLVKARIVSQIGMLIRESGLTRRAFARREGIRYTTFCNWTQGAAKRAGAGLPAVAPVRFAEVALPASASMGGGVLEVRLADGTTVRGGNVEELAALVRALRS